MVFKGSVDMRRLVSEKNPCKYERIEKEVKKGA